MSRVVLEQDGLSWTADLSDPLSLAMPLDFDGPQPNHFGAPRAHAAPLASGGFVGDVRRGGSVNCELLSFVPHCNGTHTECVGHLTTDRVAVHEVLKGGLHVARVVSVRPEPVGDSADSADPDAAPDEPVVTARLLRAALERLPGRSTALVVRTLPNDSEKLTRRYEGPSPAPYLTPEAADVVVDAGVSHLVVDVPSLDRAHDGGRLAAHRRFFGLPGGARRLHDAARADSTVTELAWIAPTIRDGWYLMSLQVPALLTDAVPSRPLLYPARLRDA
jgi:kynurenine formamidase